MSLDHHDPLGYLQGLYQLIPEDRLAFILDRTGRQSRRRRRLPASSVAWLVIAMGLFADLPIPQVWRRLHPSADEPEPVESAFTQARQRLGARPLELLFHRVCRPVAPAGMQGAFHGRWLVVALDGTVLEAPDTPANRRALGAASNQHGPGSRRLPAGPPAGPV